MSDYASKIRALAEAKAWLSEANKAAKLAKKEHDEIEADLILSLKEDEMDKVSAAGFTASYGTETVAQVDDWDAFYEYIKETGYFHLLQRRISSTAYREVISVDGEAPPGTDPIERDKLSFTKSGK